MTGGSWTMTSTSCHPSCPPSPSKNRRRSGRRRRRCSGATPPTASMTRPSARSSPAERCRRLPPENPGWRARGRPHRRTARRQGRGHRGEAGAIGFRPGRATPPLVAGSPGRRHGRRCGAHDRTRGLPTPGRHRRHTTRSARPLIRGLGRSTTPGSEQPAPGRRDHAPAPPQYRGNNLVSDPSWPSSLQISTILMSLVRHIAPWRPARSRCSRDHRGRAARWSGHP